jgi:type I restriction enzyme M protein
VKTQLKDQTNNKGTIGKIYGQENNITTYNLARMNMLLHGIKDTEFEIYHGDTLKNQWDILNEMNPAKKTEFDAIVANPPFSLRWEPNEPWAKISVSNVTELAPKSAAEFCFPVARFPLLKPRRDYGHYFNTGVLSVRSRRAHPHPNFLKTTTLTM